MRPKKVILLVDSNEKTMSYRRFVLENWGYRVLSASSVDEAIQTLEQPDGGRIELLVARLVMTAGSGNRLVYLAKGIRPEIRTLLFEDRAVDIAESLLADAWLPKGCSSGAEFKERVHLLLLRKRGPKKPVASVSTVDRNEEFDALGAA
jgi:DNA-binding response OmpR family regulator